MSFAPTTDIVMDVARAADPARAAALTARLEALGRGAAASSDFAQALDAVAPKAPATPPMETRAALVDGAATRPTRTDKARTQLESVVLSQFIGEMLPKDTPSAFGQGYAGDMWRSMLAERVADQIAASGRLGLAKKLFAGHPEAAAQAGAAARAAQASANSLATPAAADISAGAVLYAKGPT